MSTYREQRLSSLFNIRIDEYDKILQFQNGVCFICQREPKSIRLSVDHDHKSGLVRGLLCWSCNVALGKWRDDIDRMKRAILYLTEPPAVKALGEERYGVKGRVNRRRSRRSRRKKKQ